MNNNVTQLKLDNGLQIFLKEMHTAPIISHWVWYRVGSRYERPNYTGISHWVEHMQFKGTYRFPGSQMDRLISREGGIWNAFTHVDWTTYFETMPANKIDIAMELEADRMSNSLFDPNEVESERTVILTEKESKENDPFFLLNHAVMQAAFDQHPYRNEVIGTEEDLLRINRDDLYQHYRRYYQPANALIAIAGDFETDKMIHKVKSLYADKPSRKLEELSIEPEGLIPEYREVSVIGPGDTFFVQINYRAPSASHPDFTAFTILDSLLTGPASLNMFGGGGTSNNTCRLFSKLVERELAVSVYGGLQATIDPHVYEITLTVHPMEKPEALMSVYDTQIDRLMNKRIEGKEIEKAVKQARALFAYGLENITNQAFWLGYANMFANYHWFTNYLERLESIRPRDVQAVAQKYLNPKNRVVGFYIPNKANGETL